MLPYINNNEYIEIIIDKYTDYTYELFGTDETFYSGRPQKELIPEQTFGKHVTNLLNNNIEFNYLLNSNNLEHYLNNPDKVKDKLKQLKDLNISFLTISSPLLQDFILSFGFDNFKFVNSLTGVEVDTFLKAKKFEDIKYSRIILSEDVNKDFVLLQHLKESISLPLELHLNIKCATNCLIKHDHLKQLSWLKNFIPTAKKYCTYYHGSIFNFLSSPYIYPFEISKYKELGINFFKLSGRDKDYKDMLNIINTYTTELSAMNLLDNSGNYKSQEAELTYIDNIYLKDFFNFFRKGRGCSRQCNLCKICYKWEEKIKNDLVDINNNPKHPLYTHLH
jgi:collagenase-like PrtC family protease